MKVTYVVPRYGLDVIGGAEQAIRLLAEHLVAAGVDVEVDTTCADDDRTWVDAYPPGRTEENGVVVRRFRARSGRDPEFDQFSAKVFPTVGSQPDVIARQWLDRQGPVCPEVLDAAADSHADALLFSPYLFWPTVHGVLRFGRRSVLHPATHDEPPIHLPLFREVFASSGGLAFYTPAEQQLTGRLFPRTSALAQTVVGLGVDGGEGDPAAARVATGVGDRPFLLCLGRVDLGKGTGLLERFFGAYKQRHPGPLALLYVGPVKNHPQSSPDVVVAGSVSEAVKWGVLQAAEVVVSPSTSESFSIALLEGWSAGCPALVNAACAATAGHVSASRAGLTFDSYASFEVALERLLADATLRRNMGEAGRRYVAERYRWGRLIGQYRAFLTQVARAATVAAG